MVTATVLVLIFSPLFYVLIEKFIGRQARQGSTGTGAFRGWMKKFTAGFNKQPSAGAGSESASGEK
jgi:hypothetical protein